MGLISDILIFPKKGMLVLDHVLLGQPGVLPDSRPDLGGVHVDEVREEHVHGAVVNR